MKPSATGRQAFDQEGETEPNRDTASQIETTHQTSQPQVAVGASRNDPNWPGQGSPPLLDQRSPGHGSTLDDIDSALRSSRKACSRFPRGIDSSPGRPLSIPTPEMGGGGLGKPPAARESAAHEDGPWRRTGRGSHSPLAGSPRRVDDAGGPPRLWYAGVGWIYCTARLLTHRRAWG